jgi:hypothetical protein
MGEDIFDRLLGWSSARYVLVIATYEAFFDEAGTDAGCPAAFVGGFLFKKADAQSFVRQWRRRVKPLLPEGAEAFHATDCFHHTGAYQGMEFKDRENLFVRMIDLINRYAMLGVIVGIEKGEYSAFKKASPGLQSRVGSPYSLCALWATERVGCWLTDQGRTGRVFYYYEGSQYTGELYHFLDQAENNDQVRDRLHLKSFAMSPKDGAIPLQAADLLAWEWNRLHVTAMIAEHGTERKRRDSIQRIGVPILKPIYLTKESASASVIVNAFRGLQSNRNYAGRRNRD